MTSEGGGDWWHARRSNRRTDTRSSSSNETSGAVMKGREQADLPVAGVAVTGPEAFGEPTLPGSGDRDAAPKEKAQQPADWIQQSLDWTECLWKRRLAGAAAGGDRPDGRKPATYAKSSQDDAQGPWVASVKHQIEPGHLFAPRQKKEPEVGGDGPPTPVTVSYTHLTLPTNREV